MSTSSDQSEKKPFKSIYKEGYVTGPNYLCELIFQRRGEFDKNAVPQSMWNNPKFKQQYVGQLVHINKLLKEYEISTLITAFNATRVLSVTNPKYLEKVREIHAQKIDQIRIIQQTESDPETKPKTAFGTKKLFGDL
jgi:hypothetical protein